jgi:hypothetical protein
MSSFSKKGKGLLTEIPRSGIDYPTGRKIACIASRAWGAFWALQTHGRRLGQLTKCDRMPLAVSLEPQRQPHSIRLPGGRPRLLGFEILRRRSTCSEAAGRFGIW